MNNISYDVSADISFVKKNIKIFVKNLFCENSSKFDILHCQNVIEIAKNNDKNTLFFDLVFNISQKFCYKSKIFRNIFEFRMNHTLIERIVFAKQITKFINYIHTFDFVHKNVWFEIIFELINQNFKFDFFFFVEFEKLRMTNEQTFQRKDLTWKKNFIVIQIVKI